MVKYTYIQLIEAYFRTIDDHVHKFSTDKCRKYVKQYKTSYDEEKFMKYLAQKLLDFDEERSDYSLNEAEDL